MATSTTPTPSPEVKAILKQWCNINREKYGEDWKNILAKEMSEQVMQKLPQIIKDKLNKS